MNKRDNLAEHRMECAERYEQLRQRFDQVETRLTMIESGLREIKSLLEREQPGGWPQWIWAIGLAAAAGTAMAYLR